MNVIESLKEAADLAKKLGNIDLYKKIVELEGDIIEVTRQKLHLELKVDELQKQIALKSAMRFKEPFYYQQGDAVPFCPRCCENDGRAVHVIFHYENDAESRWDCPQCKQEYLVRKPDAYPRSYLTPEW
jgi:hypothetical protein